MLNAGNYGTHISYLRYLLEKVPGVTEEQATIYLAKHFCDTNPAFFIRSIRQAESKKIIWRETIGETSILCNAPEVARQITTWDFPYAFWLFLAFAAPGEHCQYAMHPFLAQFARMRPDGSEVIAEVTILDCKGSKLPLSLANEIYTATVAKLRQFKMRPTEMWEAFWRVLVLKNVPNDFLQSRDYELLQGVGFTHFFEAIGYEKVPQLIAKNTNLESAWGRFLT